LRVAIHRTAPGALAPPVALVMQPST
jgi:hypothetical protein